jgi:hypothetical protein
VMVNNYISNIFSIYFYSFKALQALLHGLVTNTACKTLELKVDYFNIICMNSFY